MDKKIFWVCSEYYKIKCRARIVSTTDGFIRKAYVVHNHPPNIDRVKQKLEMSFTSEEC